MNILLCEEVRNEVGGLKTLVGVFGPVGLYVPKVPHIFPKFGLFVTSDLKEGYRFSFEISDPSGNAIFKSEMPPVAEKTDSVQFAVNISPLVMKEFGTYGFTVRRNDGSKSTAVFNLMQTK